MSWTYLIILQFWYVAAQPTTIALLVTALVASFATSMFYARREQRDRVLAEVLPRLSPDYSEFIAEQADKAMLEPLLERFYQTRKAFAQVKNHASSEWAPAYEAYQEAVSALWAYLNAGRA